MRIDAFPVGDRPSAYMAEVAKGIKYAADRATEATAKATVREGRLVIAPALGPKAANTYGITQKFPHPEKSLAEYVGSRWFRGRDENILAGFATGLTITPKRSQFLAVPLDVAATGYTLKAGAIPNLNQATKKRTTPAVFEAATGRKLRPIRSRNGFIYLVADLPTTPKPVLRATRLGNPNQGLIGKGPGLGGKGRGLIGRSTYEGPARPATVSVPIFVLRKEVKIPQKFDYEPVREFWQPYLRDAFYLELDALGLLS